MRSRYAVATGIDKMTNRNTILNELKDLESSLGSYSPQNLYTVPNGYFEGLPTQILNRIKALEATEAKEELEYLSPLLSTVSKKMPYSVPAGFFQDLGNNIAQQIGEPTNHLQKESFGQTSEEEIESLSPLLSSLKNKNPYSIPAGYFETLETKVDKKEAKVISITKRRWYRFAVAAAVIGIVVIGGLLFMNQGQPDVNKNPRAWVNKNVNKKVSQEKIDEFVKLAEDESINTTEDNDATKQAEIKELMKDVPEKEIEDFLNDAVALESNGDTDALMN
ncbi:MAG TPA: hypothetical protein VFH08_11530 [Chitinophagaceae bacterium]|nr:hypothetical protein [Chitinophagaceae bacterium]